VAFPRAHTIFRSGRLEAKQTLAVQRKAKTSIAYVRYKKKHGVPLLLNNCSQSSKQA